MMAEFILQVGRSAENGPLKKLSALITTEGDCLAILASLDTFSLLSW